MKLLVSVLISIVMFAYSGRAVAVDNPTREFLMSCTYGVLAGTLVGAASLAFVDKPGDNLNRVARGASLGLYAGILLGLYVVYIVPGLETTEEEQIGKLLQNQRFVINPTISPQGVDGAQAEYIITRF